MEYEGAGSFWAQLSASQGGEVLFMSRKIDELLKDQTSSLIDILSDDEVISEFRSANPKLVSRIVDTEGLKLLIDVITYRDLPDSLTPAQRLQLPFIATELVACEVDQLLDAFVREVPGQQSPIDRLFDFLIEGSCRDPTVLGYVSRVLSILISRRAQAVDKYIAESEGAIHQAFIDMCFDHSVCELVIRLLVEDDVRIFPAQFSLFTFVSKNRHGDDNTGLYVLDNVLNRPGVMHERIVQIFQRFEKDARDTLGIAPLIDSALTDRDSGAMEILSLLIGFCFKYSSFSEMSTPHWESFLPSSSHSSSTHQPLPFAGGQDDDSCVFDDEEPPKDFIAPPVTIPRFAPTPFTDFGHYLVESLSAAISANSDGLVEEFLDSITHLVSFFRIVYRVVSYSSSTPRIPTDFVAKICMHSMFKYPHSSAIHNLCRDCLTCSTWSLGQLELMAQEFVPKAVKFLEISHKSSGGCYGHVCRILHHFVSEMGTDRIVTIFGDDSDMVLAASKRWIGEISVRLGANGGGGSSTSISSPRTAGAIPIVDIDIPDDMERPQSPPKQMVTQLVIEEELEPWSSQKMIRSNRSISDDENDENNNPK